MWFGISIGWKTERFLLTLRFCSVSNNHFSDGDDMTYLLKFRYDDRDFLEIWLPEFDSESDYDLESGLYEYASAAKHKGSNRAFDSIMVDAFSKAYPDIIDEVKRKEPPVEKENYDVPGLNLYQVRLSAYPKTHNLLI
jgi:hypothetical protein